MTQRTEDLQPARPERPRGRVRGTRRLGAFAAAAIFVAAAAAFTTGCSGGQRDPSGYAGAEEAFMDGCVSLAESDNDAIGNGPSQTPKTRISSPSDYCRCVFEEVSATVPFVDFKRINATLRDEGGALPGAFRSAYASCNPASEGGEG